MTKLVAGLHHAGVVDVHILHEEPRAHTVVGQLAALLHQLHHVVIEQQSGLVLRVGGTVVGTASPQVAIGAVLHLEEAVVQHLALHAGLQVSPQGYLGTVQRSLLHDGKRAIGILGHQPQQQVGLVGGVAQEVAGKDRHRALQFAVQQPVESRHDGLRLLGKGQACVRDVQHDVAFGHAAGRLELEYLGPGLGHLHRVECLIAIVHIDIYLNNYANVANIGH